MSYSTSQNAVLYAAFQVFSGMQVANPKADYARTYDITCPDSKKLTVRSDCTGMMGAVIRYLGYDVVSESAEDWASDTNTLIKDSDGNFTKDWEFMPFSVDKWKPGDILVEPGHVDMRIYDSNLRSVSTTVWNYRGLSGGSTAGLRKSYEFAEYVQDDLDFNFSESTLERSNRGATTITDRNAKYIIRYVGSGNVSLEKYDTNKTIFDVHYNYQRNYLGKLVISNSGGIIINIGYAMLDKVNSLVEASKEWFSQYRGKIALGLYLYTYINSSSSEVTMVSRFTALMQEVRKLNLTSEELKLGCWLDMEEGSIWGTAAENLKQFKVFQRVCDALGLTGTVGIYGSLHSTFTAHFNSVDLVDIPLWVAHYDLSTSELKSEAAKRGWTKVYIHQYGVKNKGYGDIDCDVLTQPIPYLGSGVSGGGGSVNSNGYILNSAELVSIPTVTPSIKPTVVNKGQKVSFTTDLAGGVIRYTLDDTLPNEKSSVYKKEIIIDEHTHIRVALFSSDGILVNRQTFTYLVKRKSPNLFTDNTLALKSWIKAYRVRSNISYLVANSELENSLPQPYTVPVVTDDSSPED